MKKVIIKDIDINNWYECCKLKTLESQKGFVAPNSVSLAQSKYETTMIPRGIYCGDKLVGFAMYNTIKEEFGAHWLDRLMIDQKYQGNGIGKKAMLLIIDEMKKIKECNKIALSYVLENTQGEEFYEKLGFKYEGEILEGEKVVILEV